MTHIQLIPLAQLRLSPRNVRKTGGTDVDDLAASIAAERVLNNLVVTDAGDGTYEVEDGGRRLLALQQLQRRGLSWGWHATRIPARPRVAYR